MFEKLRSAMQRASSAEPVRSQAAAAQPPVTVPRPVQDGGTERMGYLERRADSARPVPCPPVYLRTAAEDIMEAWPEAAGHSRSLIENSGYIAFGAELATAWTVGTGLVPNVTPDHEALGWTEDDAQRWASKLERRFADWSNDAAGCDSQGRQTFGALQGAGFKSFLATGDVLALLDFGRKQGSDWRTAINLIDPTRLWTPPYLGFNQQSLYDGIELDQRGRALAYWIRPIDRYANGQAARIRVWGAQGQRLVSHTFDGEAGAIRGISPLAPAIAAALQAQNVADAAILAAHVSAMLVGVVTSDLPTDSVVKALGGDGDPLAKMTEARVNWHAGLKDKNAHLTLGRGAKIAHLSTGERFDLYAGKQGFDQYLQIIRLGIGEIARAFGLAPEHLLDKSEANYASLKAALIEVRPVIERRRRVLVQPLCEWALNLVAEELIDRGELEFPSRGYASPLEAFRALRTYALRATWIGPSLEDPDALKAARAAAIRVTTGLSSLSDEIAATGKDPEGVFRQRAHDKRMLDSLGITLPWPDTRRGSNGAPTQ